MFFLVSFLEKGISFPSFSFSFSFPASGAGGERSCYGLVNIHV